MQRTAPTAAVTAPRVLRVMTRLNVGGPARQELTLGGALAERGYACRLAWGETSPGEGRLFPPKGMANSYIPTLRRPIDPADDVRAYRSIAGLIRRWRPWIVDTQMAKAGALGRLAAHRAGVPIVVHTFRGHVLNGYFSRGRSAAFLHVERTLARWSDALLAVSPLVRDELLDLGVGRRSQWHVVPCGVDLRPFLETRESREEARARLDLPLEGPVIGIVGRLTSVKDHDTFLRAAARVAADHPDATFVVAGDGELRPGLERLATALLRDRCRFVGWVSDLPAFYSAIDVVALTSRSEGAPVALVEAAASGVPAVATAVGGVPDVVLDGQTGLLVPPGNAREAAAAIGALLDEPERARAMGLSARESARSRFGVDRLADRVAEIYAELLARKGLVARDVAARTAA